MIKLFNKKIVIIILLIVISGLIWYVTEFNRLSRNVSLATVVQTPAEVEKIYRHALLLFPFYKDFELTLANSLLLQGKFDDAEKHFKALLDKSPHHLGVLGGLSLIYLGQNKLDSAQRVCEKILSIDDKSMTANLDLAEIYRRENEYDRAEQFIKKAMEYSNNIPKLHPNKLMASKKAIEILNEQHRFDDAVGLMALMLQYRPDDKTIIFELGKDQEYLRDKERASAAWSDFLKKTEEDFKKYRACARERFFAQERIKEIEKDNFLTPPSPQQRLNWGEIRPVQQ